MERTRPLTDWEAVVLRPGRYEVPLDRTGEFEELLRRAEEIYQRHALGWLVLRSRKEPTLWREFGHQFREEADLRAAREELERPPSILDALNEFETGHPTDSYIEQYEGSEWETVFQIGGEVGRRERPPIPPEKMTETMRQAQALAASLAPRLAKVAPPGFKVWADQEVVLIEEPDGFPRGCSLVDLERDQAVIAALGELGEVATEELAVPWPHDEAQGYKFHEPQVEVRDGALHAWYGVKDKPVLRLDPIPLDEIER